MVDSKVLIECPFCGSTNVNDTAPPVFNHGLTDAWVCPDCVAVGPVGRDLAEATAKWNTRAPARPRSQTWGEWERAQQESERK